jgi:pimeloyl-ACP methyl ester carboxylesterase
MTVETSHGRVAYRDSDGTGMPVVMIHGNSNSGRIFRNQSDGALGRTYRIIAPDLLGHGYSLGRRRSCAYLQYAWPGERDG